MPDVGVLQVQTAAGRVVAIAFFRHGHADDARVRMRNARQHGLRIFRRNQHFKQAADYRCLLLLAARRVRAAQRQGVQARLRRQRIARVGLPQGHAANAPGQVRAPAPAHMQRGFVHRSKMRARERAQPQMHDAHAQGVAVVRRPCHVQGQRGQTSRCQVLHTSRYQFHSVPSCCKRFTGR
ncbi:hypothetical protein D3C87_1526530 [compost metagenome]